MSGELKFAAPALEQEWAEGKLNPKLTGTLLEFARWSAEHALPAPVVTCLSRSREHNAKLYIDHWRRLLQASGSGVLDDVAGDRRPLAPDEEAMLRRLTGLPDLQLQQLAEGRFSWHLVGCAADLRTRHYGRGVDHARDPPASEMMTVVRYLRERHPRPTWEALLETAGGPHFHLAVRDETWRREQEDV